MVFAEFYHMSVAGSWNNFKSEPIPACGDRAVIILDGRMSIDNQAHQAHQECKKRGYIGYTLNRGERFNDAKEIKKYESV